MIDLQGEVFEFYKMHLHWRGSEHSVNGRHFADELHLVFISLVVSSSNILCQMKYILTFYLHLPFLLRVYFNFF